MSLINTLPIASILPTFHKSSVCTYLWTHMTLHKRFFSTKGTWRIYNFKTQDPHPSDCKKSFLHADHKTDVLTDHVYRLLNCSWGLYQVPRSNSRQIARRLKQSISLHLSVAVTTAYHKYNDYQYHQGSSRLTNVSSNW
jgi:hypothetical protein